jgi:hypothetical protein
MKSRITIEVDFEDNNAPIIKILQKKSEDIRDQLLQQFLERLEHRSPICRILCWSSVETEGERGEIWKIRPITPNEFPSIINDIKPEMVNIHDNSHGFRQFLDDQGIKWKPNEHYTLVDASVDLFTLGRQVEKARANSQPA